MKTLRLVLLAGIATLTLSACVGPSTKLGIVPNQQAALAQSAIVVDAVPAGATAIGDLAGVSCKNKIWDPPATQEVALQQLKAQALLRGAKGIAKVEYRSEGTTLTANCWEAIYATGTAFR